MKAFSEAEKAWLACAIDGEGNITKLESIGLYSYVPTVSVYNTNIDFIRRVSDLTGARVCADKPSENHKWSLCYYVSIHAHAEVLLLLEQVLPYLIIKRKLAEDVICYIEDRRWRTYGGGGQKGAEEREIMERTGALLVS